MLYIEIREKPWQAEESLIEQRAFPGTLVHSPQWPLDGISCMALSASCFWGRQNKQQATTGCLEETSQGNVCKSCCFPCCLSCWVSLGESNKCLTSVIQREWNWLNRWKGTGLQLYRVCGRAKGTLPHLRTYRILEAKENHLHLVDAVAVEVQLQFQFWQCSGYDFSVSGPHKLSEACDEGRDVFPF